MPGRGLAVAIAAVDWIGDVGDTGYVPAGLVSLRSRRLSFCGVHAHLLVDLLVHQAAEHGGHRLGADRPLKG
jgi:hypothetical protein